MSDHELQRQAEEHAAFFRALVSWFQEREEKRLYAAGARQKSPGLPGRLQMQREIAQKARRRAERMAVLLSQHHNQKFLALKRQFLAALKQDSS